MERVGILYHPLNKAASPLASELNSFLSARGISAWVCSSWDTDRVKGHLEGTDLILTVGGDGTILRAAQAVVAHSIPITGINLGKLGFMTELNIAEAKDKLIELVEGKGWIDERHMLEASINATDMDEVHKLYALNDMVMARGEIARMIRVKAFIDGEELTTYRADGVILSTATGSTGYALSAGGPILHPQSDEFLLLPILPHLSLAYTLVLPHSSTVGLCIDAAHMTTLSVDGHINLPIPSGAEIKVQKSAEKTLFLRVHPKKSFYSSLEQRLRGKK